MPIEGPRRRALFNTGAETVENAVKIARVATGRQGVICFSGAFHGRSLMAMTLTSKVAPVQAPASARSRPRSTARRSPTRSTSAATSRPRPTTRSAS